MIDVVAIGHASIDRVRSRGKETTQLGGAAIYSAMGAKIFHRTGIVSRVGSDFPSDFYAVLKKAEIDTTGLRRRRGKSTVFWIDYDREGFAHYDRYDLNVGVHLRPEDLPPVYWKAKAFHIAPMAASKQAAFLRFLEERTDAFLSLNTHIGYFQRYRKEVLDLLPKVDLFTLNDEEAMRLTATKNLEQALDALKRLPHNLLVVTMGVYGSIVIEDEINFSPSVHQPRIVDLTGCGDAFTGAFLSSYLLSEDPLKSANIANSVASLTATDRNFQALLSLRFSSLEGFQEFIVSRQRRLNREQRSLDSFL
jgi:sugar/nucleoside kinase (ribokinase family)